MKKHRVFTLRPIDRFYLPEPEATLKTKLEHKLKEGGSYLIEEKEMGKKIFKDLTTHGIAGIWLTSSLPEKIREKNGLTKTPILCFTTERVNGEATVAPKELSRTRSILSGYFNLVFRKAVVFVDCFGKLVSANGFEKAVDFLKDVAGLCYQNNSNLLVQIHPTEFPNEQLEVMKRAIAPS